MNRKGKLDVVIRKLCGLTILVIVFIEIAFGDDVSLHFMIKVWLLVYIMCQTDIWIDKISKELHK